MLIDHNTHTHTHTHTHTPYTFGSRGGSGGGGGGGGSGGSSGGGSGGASTTYQNPWLRVPRGICHVPTHRGCHRMTFQCASRKSR